MDFDVAQWQELAKTDPEEFERRRIAMIEDLIATAPPDIQRRLRGTQFRVDMERQRASNPLSATVRISRLMWESFADLRENLNHLANGNSAPNSVEAANVPNSAAIIPLRPPGSK
jgi:Protein of unknown function (DUF3135)